MEKLTFSKLSLTDLKRFVTLQEGPIAPYPWTHVDSIILTDQELQQLQYVKSRLVNYDTQLMNEITLWARAIYPLLLLAESGEVQAWGGIPLAARYAQFEIEGVADGVLGKTVAGRIETPYLEETTKMATHLYHQDFYAWVIHNVDLLRQGKYSEIDSANLAEELDSMGKREKRELINTVPA